MEKEIYSTSIARVSYEYSYCNKIIEALAFFDLEEVKSIIHELEVFILNEIQVKSELEPSINSIKTNFVKLKEMKKKLYVVQLDEQNVIVHGTFIITFLGNIRLTIEEVRMSLKHYSGTQANQLILDYHLDFLDRLLKEILIK